MAKNNKNKKQNKQDQARHNAAIAAPGEETIFDPGSDYGYDAGKKGKPHLDTQLGEHAVTQNPEDYFNLLLAQGGVDPTGVTPYHQWAQSDGYNLTQTGYGAALLKNPELSYQQYMEQAFRVPQQSSDYVPGPASPAPGTPPPPPTMPPVAAPPSFQNWLSATHGIGPRERGDLNNARRNRLQSAYQTQLNSPASTAADAAPPAPPALDQFVQQQAQTQQQHQQAQQPFTPVDTGNPFTSQSAPAPGQSVAPAPQPGVSQQRAHALKKHGKTNQLQNMRERVQPAAPAAEPTPFSSFMQNQVQAQGLDTGVPNPSAPSLGPMMGQLRKTFQSYTPEQRGTYMSGYSPGPARWAAYG